jgi:hypothetical protein
MHLEATRDLRDGEQLDLVAVPIAEQLEDSLSDEIHERQIELRDDGTVIRRAHLEHPASDVGPESPRWP